jgi:hypothetical protein
MRFTPGISLALALVACTPVFGATVYYTDQPTGAPGSVISVKLDGSATSNVVTYPGTPSLRGIAWHRASGRIYVLDNDAKMIRSILPNGSSQLDVAPVNAAFLGSDLEVDDIAGKIFWAETNTGTTGDGFIRSANLDGTSVATAVAAGPGSESPYFIFVDRPAGFIYWGVNQAVSGQNNPTTFRRASFAGVIDLTFSITTQSRSRDIAVDPRTSIAYWADRQSGIIFKRELTGFFNEVVISGMNAPHGVAIDSKARKVYWADTGQRGAGSGLSARRVARCNFDGNEFEALTSTTGLNEPWDLALDLSCPTFADWRSRFFTTTSPLRNQTDDADDDGGENLAEYAFDSNPRDGGDIGGPRADGNGIRFPRRRISTLTYRVEVSTDFVTWRYNGDTSGQTWTNESAVVPIDDEMDEVEIEPGAALAGAEQLFYRLRISTSEGLAPKPVVVVAAEATRLPLKKKARAKRLKR